jgi:hypothetical protein
MGNIGRQDLSNILVHLVVFKDKRIDYVYSNNKSLGLKWFYPLFLIKLSLITCNLMNIQVNKTIEVGGLDTPAVLLKKKFIPWRYLRSASDALAVKRRLVYLTWVAFFTRWTSLVSNEHSLIPRWLKLSGSDYFFSHAQFGNCFNKAM